MQGTMLGARRSLPLSVASGLTATGLVLGLAIMASSVFADASVEMVEASPTDINSWGFQPAEVTIPAGQSVTWKNSGSLAHTATATGGQFDTGSLAPGESKTVTLSTPGTIAYQCTPHPWMKGTVIVTAAAAAAPAPAAPAAAAPAPAAPAAAAPAPAAPAAAAPPAAAPAAPVAQQQIPTPTPFRFIPSGATTTTTAPAPRAGGIPMELALPLLAGGASALSGGVYLLRRGRRQDPG